MIDNFGETTTSATPDYTEQLNEIVNILKDSKNYLNDKTLFFRECMLRLYSNIEFDHNTKNTRLILRDCITRALQLTNEVFNAKI